MNSASTVGSILSQQAFPIWKQPTRLVPNFYLLNGGCLHRINLAAAIPPNDRSRLSSLFFANLKTLIMVVFGPHHCVWFAQIIYTDQESNLWRHLNLIMKSK